MSAVPSGDPRPQPIFSGAPARGRADDEVAHLRVPPHSVEAEQAVLGGLLLDNEAWDRVADMLQTSDFYRYEHRLIYEAIGALVGVNKPADIVTVHDQLRGMRSVNGLPVGEDYGGMPYLNDLAQSVPSAANIRRYAEVVRTRSIRRQLIAAADDVGSMAFQDGENLADLLDKAAATFADLQEVRVRAVPQDISELLPPVLDELDSLARGEKPSAWSTGFDALDAHLNGGFRPGEVITLAARPSVGKSSLAGRIAKNFAKKGLPVVFLSQEMPKRQCTLRWLADEAGVELSTLKTGGLNDIEWTMLSEAIEELNRLPLYVDDEPSLTITAIQGKVGARRRDKPALLVVDFIQECAGEGVKGESRDRELGRIMQGLKTIAKRMNMAVLVLSQLNRDVEKRANPVPTGADLRDSGSIEQSSDIVIFIWEHPVRYVGHQVIGGQIYKNRDGERYVWFALEFQKKFQRWAPSQVNVRPSAAKKSSAPTGGGYPSNDDDL